MSINFYRHRDQLISSYKDVTDDKNPTEWAVYGYAKDSSDLELVTTGSGLQQLADEMDPSKIQYAFVRVVDPNTELTKYVLINWQGEGAALSRKGLCANHFRDVTGFFKGAHITITARNEDEVEPAIILEKVSKSSATKLNLKERSDPIENAAPVGTNYSRIQPAREINSAERESFWSKQQEEERRRKIEDRKRVESDRKKLEEGEKMRELREAKEREQQSLQKEREVSLRREEEKNAENRARDLLEERKLSTNDDNEDEDPEEERTKRAEVMRKKRADEARTLIAGRSTIRNARAVFEQHSDAPVLSKGPAPAPKSPAITSSVAAARQLFMQNADQNQSTSDNKGISEPVAIRKTDPKPVKTSPSAIVTNGSLIGNRMTSVEAPVKSEKVEKLIPVTPEPEPEPVSETGAFSEEDDGTDSDSELAQREEALRRAVYNDIPVSEHILEDIQEESEDAEDDAIAEKFLASASKSEHGIRARALYDYQAADETEISFDPDDIISHVDMIDPGWYQGMAPDGSYGLFPANYVEIMIEGP